MILYLLSFLDVLTATVLVLHTHFGIFNIPVVLIHGVYLGVKGLLFTKLSNDFASKIDIICSGYIIMVAFGLLENNLATVAVVVWLVWKAVFALIRLR